MFLDLKLFFRTITPETKYKYSPEWYVYSIWTLIFRRQSQVNDILNYSSWDLYMSTILTVYISIYAYTYTSSLGRVTHLIAPIGNSICRLQASTISSTVHIQYNFYSTYPIYLSTDRILATSFVDYRLQLSSVHIQFYFYSTHPMYCIYLLIAAVGRWQLCL